MSLAGHYPDNKVDLMAISLLPCMMVVLLLFMPGSVVDGQRVRTYRKGQLTEHYNVYPKDTSILHGEYRLYYKTHLIETGRYDKNKRAGLWTYFNLGNAFEFQYDYRTDSIVRISGMERQMMLREESPCFFLGSPLVPYVFISSQVGYPLEAFQDRIQGKVDLYLIISEYGEILRRYTGESDHPILTKAVMQASREFPTDWRWLPERKNSERLESIYKITIYFELD